MNHAGNLCGFLAAETAEVLCGDDSIMRTQMTVRVYVQFFPSRERKRPVLNPALALGARIIRNCRSIPLLRVLSGLSAA